MKVISYLTDTSLSFRFAADVVGRESAESGQLLRDMSRARQTQAAILLGISTQGRTAGDGKMVFPVWDFWKNLRICIPGMNLQEVEVSLMETVEAEKALEASEYAATWENQKTIFNGIKKGARIIYGSLGAIFSRLKKQENWRSMTWVCQQCFYAMTFKTPSFPSKPCPVCGAQPVFFKPWERM